MDASRFDALSRAFAQGLPRRRLLAGLAMITGLGTFGRSIGRGAEASTTSCALEPVLQCLESEVPEVVTSLRSQAEKCALSQGGSLLKSFLKGSKSGKGSKTDGWGSIGLIGAGASCWLGLFDIRQKQNTAVRRCRQIGCLDGRICMRRNPDSGVGVCCTENTWEDLFKPNGDGLSCEICPKTCPRCKNCDTGIGDCLPTPCSLAEPGAHYCPEDPSRCCCHVNEDCTGIGCITKTDYP